MFSQIFDAIEEWMRELLTGMITSNLDTMFTDVNQKTGEIATQVGQTPQVERQHIQYDPELIGFRDHADCRYYYHTRTLLRIDFYADRAQQHA